MTLPPTEHLEALLGLGHEPTGVKSLIVRDRLLIGGIPYKDVMAYGAKGDGIANDLDKINQAISDMSSEGGGIVFFPRGTYRTSAPVQGRSNVILRGVGGYESTIWCDDPDEHVLQVALPAGGGTVSKFLAEYIGITHETTAWDSDGIGVHGGDNDANWDTTEDIEFNHFVVRDIARQGFAVRKNPSRWNVHDGVIKNTGRAGFVSVGGFDLWTRNLFVSMTGDDGIAYTGSVTRGYIGDHWVYKAGRNDVEGKGQGRGIVLQNGQKVGIVGNFVLESQLRAIHVQYSSGLVEDILVASNHCIGIGDDPGADIVQALTTRCGMEIDATGRVYVMNNSVVALNSRGESFTAARLNPQGALAILVAKGNFFCGATDVSDANLARGSTDTAVATDAFNFDVDGTIRNSSAVASGTALATGTVPADKWGIYSYEIGADSIIDCVAGAANFTTGYDTEREAIDAIPDVSADHKRIGYVTVLTAVGQPFVGGTDALQGGTSGNPSSDTNYYDIVVSSSEGVVKVGGGSAKGVFILENLINGEKHYVYVEDTDPSILQVKNNIGWGVGGSYNFLKFVGTSTGTFCGVSGNTSLNHTSQFINTVSTTTITDFYLKNNHMGSHNAQRGGNLTGITNWWGELIGTVGWNPADLASGSSQSTTATITGAKIGDIVRVSFSLSLGNSFMVGHVTAADTVTIVHANLSGSNENPGNGTVNITVEREPVLT